MAPASHGLRFCTNTVPAIPIAEKTAEACQFQHIGRAHRTRSPMSGPKERVSLSRGFAEFKREIKHSR